MKLNIEVKRKRIKNYIVRVYSPDKIVVSVPLATSQTAIESFINSKKTWIEKTVLKLSEKKLEENKIKLLGKKLELKIFEADENKIFIEGDNLIIFKKEGADIDYLIKKYLHKELSKILDKKIKYYSQALAKGPDKFIIKEIKTAWGIYHKRKNYVTFNLKLIEHDVDVIAYVVLHELCHIFEMNHQKQFWSLVEKHMPNYRELRKKLK